MSIQELREQFRYRVARFLLIGPFLFIWGRPKTTGRHNIPRHGAVILTANHLAITDSFYVVQCARRRVFFLAKSDYFTQPGLKGKFKKTFFSGMGQIPVDRSGGDASSPAIVAATKIVEAGEAWGIHPEGTRSPDGRMYKGKTGAIRVAVATGSPVVPIALRNTADRNWRNFWRSRVYIDILPAMDLSGIGPDDHDKIRAATDDMMAAIRAKTGQEYVNVYAKPGSAGAK
ncbi:MAG TPA: lysophospholipid acyltransferase family protein [Gordonia sp. (in: high G+C Gram-positive bacteria)]|uniref:lysophospholipid acyltransferase family protein n=1 Tax=unclassified Gordonia (in: high G+C Gram-positive bacteria) TaxID=2657482 RepID=UPI000FB01E30|nr:MULTISPECIES: lysophospholipid acyltransferase family protein [unclassified Gordonia (in: high G+C Gram-positive bacteria)]RUP36881.1 MAG: 1-acyl-sn-glycerol-3-phosphate acyltransferase [Gordonia sp. (in: high G+C Gram-positive bacteria)]HNP58538.1 lysophospholipid acyltransferase family protein [Gordonia sp. (in: high G+C Gram-positive bacteria)]HRC50265.1 lysophospholipid acyltransferase family protein [Gordonia sp. (in: high G+C Gram-positive bacteria)]